MHDVSLPLHVEKYICSKIVCLKQENYVSRPVYLKCAYPLVRPLFFRGPLRLNGRPGPGTPWSPGRVTQARPTPNFPNMTKLWNLQIGANRTTIRVRPLLWDSSVS